MTTLDEVQAAALYEGWSLRHADSDQRLRRLPYYWASAHTGDPQPEWLAQPREAVVHVSVNLSGTAKTMPYMADDEYPEGLSTQAKAVFSSVARHLRRRLRGHARCVEFFRHEIWWRRPKRTAMFPNEPCRGTCRHLMKAMRDDLHTRWQELVDAAEHLASENDA